MRLGLPNIWLCVWSSFCKVCKRSLQVYHTSPSLILLSFVAIFLCHVLSCLLSCILTFPPSIPLVFVCPLLHPCFEVTTRRTSSKGAFRVPSFFSQKCDLGRVSVHLWAFLSLPDFSARKSSLSELTGRSNNIHFRNTWLQTAAVLQIERKWSFFLQCRMGFSGNLLKLNC